MQQPSIFEFTTIESFLTKHFSFRKLKNPHFSYNVWAHRLKLKAPSALCMAVKGARPPSEDLSLRLKRDLGLDERESRYFDLLVGVKKQGHDLIRALDLMKELEQTHPQKGFKLLEQDQFRAISNWYHYAILEAVEANVFVEDPVQLSLHFDFNVSDSELREAIQTLLRLGLLARNKAGKLIRIAGPIRTHSDRSDEGLKQYHEQTLNNAIRSIRTQESSEREIRGLSLSVRASKIPEAKKRIHDFVQEFCREFDGGEKSDQVYQLEICFFRLLNMKMDQGVRK